MSSSIFRIFITTDTHLGFKERDPVRADDPFNTFEEALTLARAFKVDFLLHSGDLFDVQKPTQPTLHRALQLLGKYCLGPDPVRFHRLKDVNTASIPLNIEDDNINVALPVFMVHGNHDPPSAQEGRPVSPLDILSSALLINDIGKVHDLDNVVLKPVLLEKGSSKIALYGMGHIRDERMHRIFTLEKIVFEPPPNPDEYFCIFMIHQNRYKGAQGGMPPKSCVHEEMLPDFLDLVIWGHEHDTHIDPVESLKGQYHIIQPGSSVVTSLSAGEATFKRNCILEVFDQKFRLRSFPLLSARPFIFRDLEANEVRKMLENEQDLWKSLEGVVREMLTDATAYVKERSDDWDVSMKQVLLDSHDPNKTPSRWDQMSLVPDGPPEVWLEALKKRVSRPQVEAKPLLRLRVDMAEMLTETFPTARFGNAFVGDVANPDDLLHLKRKRGDLGTVANTTSKTLPAIEITKGAAKEVHDLIFHHVSDKSALEMLVEPELNIAVKDYVDRADTGALEAVVSKLVNDTQKALKQLKQEDREADVGSALKERTKGQRLALWEAQRTEAVSTSANTEARMSSEQEMTEPSAWTATPTAICKGAKVTGSDGIFEKQDKIEEEADLDDSALAEESNYDFGVPSTAAKAAVRTKRSQTGSSSRFLAASSGSDSEDDRMQVEPVPKSCLSVSDESEDAEGPPVKMARGKAKAKSRSATKGKAKSKAKVKAKANAASGSLVGMVNRKKRTSANSTFADPLLESLQLD